MSPAGGNAEHAKGEITRLLMAWSEGDLEALDLVLPLAFDDLRRIARKCCQRIHVADLQPTELIGEIYAVLLQQKQVNWEGRGQFFQFAAFLMERVLLSYKRSLAARKRGGQFVKTPLADTLDAVATLGGEPSLAPWIPASATDQEDVLGAIATAIDVAEKIAELEELDPRQAEIARLRYLIGLTIEETAETLGVSISTVKQLWRNAKRYLALELEGYAVE